MKTLKAIGNLLYGFSLYFLVLNGLLAIAVIFTTFLLWDFSLFTDLEGMYIIERVLVLLASFLTGFAVHADPDLLK